MGVGDSHKPPDSFNIPQLDGCPDTSFLDSNNDDNKNNITSPLCPDRTDTITTLPTVATYNMRSFFPKIENFKTDMKERNIQISFLSEIWQKSDDKDQQAQIQSMCEVDGLDYISTPRTTTRGGGAAIIVNREKFSVVKLDIIIPKSLDVVWGLVRPHECNKKFNTFIVCSFYSPPNRGKNRKMCEHLVPTLHMLQTKYPESGIIMGSDKNKMDIQPIINCGLKLKQVVDKPTRKGKILDVIIMNLYQHYNSPVIVPPIGPDDPTAGLPSDHEVPVCVPHTDRHSRPKRNYRTVTYRPLPDSSVRLFGQWVTAESWDQVTDNKLSPTEQVECLQDMF